MYTYFFCSEGHFLLIILKKQCWKYKYIEYIYIHIYRETPSGTSLLHTHKTTRKHKCISLGTLSHQIFCIIVLNKECKHTQTHTHWHKHTHSFLCALVHSVFFMQFWRSAHRHGGKQKTTYKQLHTCAQRKNNLLLVCPSSKDVSRPTGKSTELKALGVQGGKSQMWHLVCMWPWPAVWLHVRHAHSLKTQC